METGSRRGRNRGDRSRSWCGYKKKKTLKMTDNRRVSRDRDWIVVRGDKRMSKR